MGFRNVNKDIGQANIVHEVSDDEAGHPGPIELEGERMEIKGKVRTKLGCHNRAPITIKGA